MCWRFRSSFIIALVAMMFAAALPISAAARLPNIVFILADDLGWSDLKCYGADLIETPNIDRLAREGARFTDFYSASPVCSPTRASILTGMHPAYVRMTTWFEAAHQPTQNRMLLPPQTEGYVPITIPMITDSLRGRYITALVGKWHLGDVSHYPEAYGFDINIGGTQWGAPETYFYPYRGSRTWGDGFRYVPHLEFGKPNEYLTDRLTDEALQVIDRSGSKPFFLYLAHHAPHTPVEAKSADIQTFQAKMSPQSRLHHRNAKYAAMIWSLDQSVGRVLSKLKERKLEKDTLVIFTSDNGGYVGKWKGETVTDNYPLRSGKGSLYEGGIRVPLIIRWPGVTSPGMVCHEPSISTSLYELMMEAAGIEVSPPNVPTLLSLLKNEKAPAIREPLCFHYPHYYETTTPASAIRSGDWKLIYYYETKRSELYNLRGDIGEAVDLAATYPEKVAQLKTQLDEWLTKMSAQLPAPNPDYRPRSGK